MNFCLHGLLPQNGLHVSKVRSFKLYWPESGSLADHGKGEGEARLSSFIALQRAFVCAVFESPLQHLPFRCKIREDDRPQACTCSALKWANRLQAVPPSVLHEPKPGKFPLWESSIAVRCSIDRCPHVRHAGRSKLLHARNVGS